MLAHTHILYIECCILSNFFFIQFAVDVKEKKNFNNSKKDLIAAKFSSSSCLNVPSSISLYLSRALAFCSSSFLFFYFVRCISVFLYNLVVDTFTLRLVFDERYTCSDSAIARIKLTTSSQNILYHVQMV